MIEKSVRKNPFPDKIVPGRPTLGEIREKVAKLGLTETDVDEAIRWARKQKK